MKRAGNRILHVIQSLDPIASRWIGFTRHGPTCGAPASQRQENQAANHIILPGWWICLITSLCFYWPLY